MTQLLDIPEDDKELPRWLESILVSPNFGKTIAQLVYIQTEDSNPHASADAFTDKQLRQFAKVGLTDATYDQCKAFLRQPAALVALNDAIFAEGDSYWIQRIANASRADHQFLDEFAKANFAPVDSEISRSKERSNSDNGQARDAADSSFSRRSIFALAAALLVAAFGYSYYQNNLAPKGEDWGWQSANALPRNLPQDEYLRSIGEVALEWFEQPSNTPAQLAANLQTLSSGCQRLIEDDHPSLSDANREWLIEKCTDWKQSIDLLVDSASEIEHLDEAKQQAIKNAADDLVSKISLTLNNRADAT